MSVTDRRHEHWLGRCIRCGWVVFERDCTTTAYGVLLDDVRVKVSFGLTRSPTLCQNWADTKVPRERCLGNFIEFKDQEILVAAYLIGGAQAVAALLTAERVDE